MPKATATTADEISDTLRTFIDRVVDAKLTQEMTKRGQDVADRLAERGADLGDRASDMWRESRPLRRDAAKRMARASGDAARWSEQTWRRALRPALKDLWSRRTLAIGAAGAAVPAGRELIDTAAARLSRRQREERHWGVFFLGLVLGVAAGAIAALLTAPKRGSEMRRELTVRADEMRQEIASRAKDAEWVPIFQRDEVTNGYPQETLVEASEPVEDAASEATATVSEAVEDAGEAVDTAVDTAGDAVDEAYDTVDREST
jgi:gas vesicle protein